MSSKVKGASDSAVVPVPIGKALRPAGLDGGVEIGGFDGDLVVMAPVALKDQASTVADKLQQAATGEGCIQEYEEHGQIYFMVTHA